MWPTLKRATENPGRVPFGTRPDGRLVDASEVARGKACNCLCPGCKLPLIARHGSVRAHHFSHASGAECANGAETALHLAAKQVLLESLQLTLPALTVSVSRQHSEFGTFEQSRTVIESRACLVESAQAEVWLEGIRPDVVATLADGSLLAVEVKVTHQVDDDKQAEIERRALPCIEIDISPLLGMACSIRELFDRVVLASDNKRWVFHAQRQRYAEELLSGYDEWLGRRREDAARRERLDAKRREAGQERQVRAAQQKRDIAARNADYRALPLKEKWKRVVGELGLVDRPWPRHLVVTLREDDNQIDSPRGLWQAALFARFIYGRASGSKVKRLLPEPWRIAAWVEQRFGSRPGASHSVAEVVVGYLHYLKGCGFLEYRSKKFSLIYDGLLPQVVPATARRPVPLEARVQRTPDVTPPSTWPEATAAQWSLHWPSQERILAWAREFCAQRAPAMNADLFVADLMRAVREPNPCELLDLMLECRGDPAHLTALLAFCGLTTSTHREIYAAELPPWLRRRGW